MSVSLVLTNCFFCCISALLLIPILKRPDLLSLKKGIGVFILLILVFIKMFIPYEFSFTSTLASKTILPEIHRLLDVNIMQTMSISQLILTIWITVTGLSLITKVYHYIQFTRVLKRMPETRKTSVIQSLSNIQADLQLRQKPRVIQLDLGIGPFITGIRTPYIVLPKDITDSEIDYILMHELQHIKHNHLLIKLITEIVLIVYWWIPIVWLLRREIYLALEMQADADVLKKLSKERSLNYLETLIRVSQKVTQGNDRHLALSFTFRHDQLKYRIEKSIETKYFKESKSTNLSIIMAYTLSFLILVTSFTYTFESYTVDDTNTEGTFTASSKNGYLVLRDDDQYDLYIDDAFVITINSLPDSLSELPVVKN